MGVLDFVREVLEAWRPQYEAAGLPTEDQLMRIPPHDRAVRIWREVEMIASRFSAHEGVYCDEKNYDWLIIPKYPLPEKWRARWCKLLIVFPDIYPLVPPIGFYLNRHFHLKNGKNDHHLVGRGMGSAPDLRMQNWHWYCVNVAPTAVAGGWRPSADYREPDNLWTFLSMIREVLTSEE